MDPTDIKRVIKEYSPKFYTHTTSKPLMKLIPQKPQFMTTYTHKNR